MEEDEEIRQYWEEQNRERFAQIAELPPPLGRKSAWAKLQVEQTD